MSGARRRAASVRPVLAVALLSAGAVTWAALPMAGATAGARPVLAVAVCCAALSLGQLADRIRSARLGPAPRQPDAYVTYAVRQWRSAVGVARNAPWAQATIVAVVALEALHPARPWHTAVLGAVLLGYLLALHLSESGDRPSALRHQLALAAAGVGLAALSAAAALLPAASTGSGWLSVAAALAAVAAAALVLPV